MKALSPLQKALPIVAATYADKFGIEVILQGKQACTTGTRVVLPAVDHPALWGWLAHECGHARETNFEVTRLVQIQNQFDLLNIIEDARIELAMIQHFPGVEGSLNVTRQFMVDEEMYSRVLPDSSLAWKFMGTILFRLRTELLNQRALIGHAEQAKSTFKVEFPLGVQVRLDSLLRKVSKLTSTEDAWALTQSIIQMLKDESEKEKSQPPQTIDSDQDQDADENGDESPQNANQDDPEEGDSTDGKHTESDPTIDDDLDLSTQLNNVDSSGGEIENQNVLDQLINSLFDEQPSDQEVSGDEFAKLSERFQSLAEENPEYSDNFSVSSIKQATDLSEATNGDSLLDEVRLTSSRIKQQLRGIVQSARQEQYMTTRRGSKLDRNKLTRLAFADSRVFQQRKVESQAVNTAIHILGDMSGSMSPWGGEDKAKVARESALALSVALQAIPGCNPAVTYFKDSRLYSALKHGGRIKAGKFMCYGDGGTPMADAIWYAAHQMQKLPEQRKLIVVISDGAPDCEADVHSVRRLCEQSGFEFIGIGIGDETIKRLFGQSIVINEVGHLQKTLFQLVGKALIN